MQLIHLIVHSYFSNDVFSMDWDHAILNLTGLRPADAIYPLMYIQSLTHYHVLCQVLYVNFGGKRLHLCCPEASKAQSQVESKV